LEDIILPRLHPEQERIWAAGAEHAFNVVRCGRRWGKTKILGNIAISYATALFKETGSETLQGGRVGIFTAEYKQQQEIFSRLEKDLAPLIARKSRSDGVIALKNKGVIDFWVTNNNPLAGRGREYDVALLDEMSFTKTPEMLEEIWPKSIRPTLTSRNGRVWAFSTPDGIDEQNFFYAMCHDPKLGFKQHHAPTCTNPYIPAEALAFEERNNDPRVFKQEFLAEFIDWSTDSLFDVNLMLDADGKPVTAPKNCDRIFAVMDTALKGGKNHDGHGVVYFAYEQTYSAPMLTVIDWDLLQISGAMLEVHLPQIFTRLDELTQQCKPRFGSGGLHIEDANTGSLLLQKGEGSGWPVVAIDSRLTAKGKDERAVMSSGYHYRGQTKIAEAAFNKTVSFKNAEANHLLKQIAQFHLADKKAGTRADDLLDCYMYGLLLAFGAGEGL